MRDHAAGWSRWYTLNSACDRMLVGANCSHESTRLQSPTKALGSKTSTPSRSNTAHEGTLDGSLGTSFSSSFCKTIARIRAAIVADSTCDDGSGEARGFPRSCHLARRRRRHLSQVVGPSRAWQCPKHRPGTGRALKRGSSTSCTNVTCLAFISSARYSGMLPGFDMALRMPLCGRHRVSGLMRLLNRGAAPAKTAPGLLTGRFTVAEPYWRWPKMLM